MGGNLWKKWPGESDEPGRNRFQAFVYSHLWPGMFPSFLVGFVVIVPRLLLGRFVYRESVGQGVAFGGVMRVGLRNRDLGRRSSR